ncbi:hypothetical protein, partial [Enterobacter hormaechei]
AQRHPPFCPVGVGLPGLPRPQKTRPLGAFFKTCCGLFLIAVLQVLNLRAANTATGGEQAIKNKIEKLLTGICLL